jgi:hypothetical protein
LNYGGRALEATSKELAIKRAGVAGNEVILSGNPALCSSESADFPHDYRWDTL